MCVWIDCIWNGEVEEKRRKEENVERGIDEGKDETKGDEMKA